MAFSGEFGGKWVIKAGFLEGGEGKEQEMCIVLLQ
jgi:hypothetical protein